MAPISCTLLQCEFALLHQEMECISPLPWVQADPGSALTKRIWRKWCCTCLVIALKWPGNIHFCLVEVSYQVRSTTLWNHHAERSPTHLERPWRMKCHVERKNSRSTWSLRYVSEEAILEVGCTASAAPAGTMWNRHKPPSQDSPRVRTPKTTSKRNYYFKPVTFGVVFYTVIDNQNAFYKMLKKGYLLLFYTRSAWTPSKKHYNNYPQSFHW